MGLDSRKAFLLLNPVPVQPNVRRGDFTYQALTQENGLFYLAPIKDSVWLDSQNFQSWSFQFLMPWIHTQKKHNFFCNLVTFCLQFVLVFPQFFLNFVTTKTKQNKDKLQIVYKNKTKQRQMTNCLQIVDN